MTIELAPLNELARRGIHFMGAQDYQAVSYAQDAQSPLVTQSNASIMSMLTTYIDPKLIPVLVSPMKTVEVVGGEVKKGDWLTDTVAFNLLESTGAVDAYGDYANGGVAGSNFNYPQRQTFHYQTITQWGERELERAGLQKVDWANQLNMSSVLTLNKFQNQSYVFGIANLQIYGLLNDPSLTTPLTPGTKTAGGTSWNNATALEVFADIQYLYRGLQTQANGLVDLNTPMTLGMSPVSQGNLTKTTEFNVNVMTLIKSNFPNMEVRTMPEYSTGSGELVQLIAQNVEGQPTAECAFTEKLRAHPVVVGLSNWQQKKSQGTIGTVIYRPFLIKQMLGV